ncbi:MAG: ArsR family transcriptional regulator [Robinsoniella sp.]|nr:ArsR family transcriptional regulator [Robinsoniella sp.]
MEECSGVRVGKITQKTHLSRPAVSHHIQILKDAGIVKMRREGTKNYYYLDADMNFSRYYRNRGKFIYGFDPNINIISTKTGRCRKYSFLQRPILCCMRIRMLRSAPKKGFITLN